MKIIESLKRFFTCKKECLEDAQPISEPKKKAKKKYPHKKKPVKKTNSDVQN